MDFCVLFCLVRGLFSVEVIHVLIYNTYSVFKMTKKTFVYFSHCKGMY